MRFAAFVLSLFTASLFSACVLTSDDPKPDPNQYLTPIAEAQTAGLTPYWLGPTIETDKGPLRAVEGIFPQGYAGVALPGIQITYFNGDQVIGTLDVLTFQKTDWASEGPRARALDFPSAKRKNVLVAGHDAELIAVPGGTRPINVYLLIVAAGDEVVVVETNSLGGGRNATPGGVDLNPLIDEQTFLSVMQNLRPYPQ
jgi:hypothetical protein